jgi:hypothetical protein
MEVLQMLSPTSLPYRVPSSYGTLLPAAMVANSTQYGITPSSPAAPQQPSLFPNQQHRLTFKQILGYVALTFFDCLDSWPQSESEKAARKARRKAKKIAQDTEYRQKFANISDDLIDRYMWRNHTGHEDGKTIQRGHRQCFEHFRNKSRKQVEEELKPYYPANYKAAMLRFHDNAQKLTHPVYVPYNVKVPTKLPWMTI